MGICKLPSFELYWNKKGNSFNQPLVANLLKYDRFYEIKKYFHVFDKDEFEAAASSAPGLINKLDDPKNYFNKKFHSVYTPEKELVIDENICSWSGKGG
jgi:hypothetical protein